MNNTLFNVDCLAKLMLSLVVFIGVCIVSFALRYMKGESKYHSFLVQLILLIFSVSLMVVSDNLLIFFLVWCLNNLLLVRLMIYKASWNAAKASGILALKNYLLGAVCIAAAFSLFYRLTGSVSITTIVHDDVRSVYMLPALLLLLVGAMTQSAIWPFHRWLISSLNSPTPASAIMHAGLVNGGGFLLVRFAPLYLQHRPLLTTIFIVGLATALLGTLWKLLQPDVKRMLACSTMGQMGFMVAQCGLGLFPAAVTHLIGHGMFKAYLFLSSGSTAQEKRFDLDYPPSFFMLCAALMCGMVGSFVFAWVTKRSWFAFDTSLVLMVLTFLGGTQFSLTILKKISIKKLPLIIFITSLMGGLYGYSVHMFTILMAPMNLMQPQPLNFFYILGVIVMVLSWLSILFFNNTKTQLKIPTWFLHHYVIAVNASQPHPETITSFHKDYKYL